MLITIGLLAVFMILALSLAIICLIFKRSLFGILSAFAWLLCDMVVYFGMDSTLYYYFPIIAFFLFCFLAMVVMSYLITTKPQEAPMPYNHTEHLREEYWRVKRARQGLRVPPEDR